MLSASVWAVAAISFIKLAVPRMYCAFYSSLLVYVQFLTQVNALRLLYQRDRNYRPATRNSFPWLGWDINLRMERFPLTPTGLLLPQAKHSWPLFKYTQQRAMPTFPTSHSFPGSFYRERLAESSNEQQNLRGRSPHFLPRVQD